MWDELDAIPWAEFRHNYGTAEDVPPLLRACADADPETAAKAAYELSNLIYHQGGWVCPAASAALPFLARLAANPLVTPVARGEVISLVRSLVKTAAAVLPKWIDGAWPAALEAATPALLALLRDTEPSVRRAAVSLAGSGGLVAGLAVPALRGRLEEEPDPSIRNDVVIAFGGAAAGTAWSGEIRAELAALLRDAPELQSRLAAVHALARMGEPVGGYVDLMAEAVTDDTAAGWQDSFSVIVRATGALLSEDPDAAVAFAAEVTRRGDGRQRVAALSHLGAILQEWRAVPGAVHDLLAGGLRDPEAEARFLAAYLMAGIGKETLPFADALAALASDDSAAGSLRLKTAVSDAAVWALIRLGDSRCLPGLRSRLTGDRVGLATSESSFGRSTGTNALFIPDLPSIGRAVTDADPEASLLDVVIARLRSAADAGAPSLLATILSTTLGRWGAKAAPAVPELSRLLRESTPGRYPSQAAAEALGRIRTDSPAVAALLRRHAREGSPEAAWALWRVSGEVAEPLTLLTSRIEARPDGKGWPDNKAIRYLADFGPAAAGSEGRLRELLAGHPNNWARTEAAHALWRITGDASAAIAALAETVQPLASPDGSFLPVRLGAMRYLAAIPDPSPGGPAAALASGAARAVLASPRRLGYNGGWRAFAEDDEIRAAAADYLAAA